MIKIQIEDELYDFPSSWEDVTLGQFMQLSMVNDSDNSVERIIKLINALTEISEYVIERISISDLSKLDLSWIDEETPAIPMSRFQFEGKEYGAVEFTKLTLGEFSDLEHFIKENYLGNVHKVMAILIRPIVDGKIEKYDSESLEERANILKNNMKIPHVNGLSAFFLNGAEVSSEVMNLFLLSQKEMRKKMKHNQKAEKVSEDGDGSEL